MELLEEPKIPSLAYRLARVASGSLDGALASANSHDWDIAGADILLSEAGAGLCDAEGRPLSYNRPETRHGPLVGGAARAASGTGLRAAARARGENGMRVAFFVPAALSPA